MESVEEAQGYNKNSSSSSSSCNNANDNDHGAHAVVKGKRTKRQRLYLPPAAAIAEAPTSSASSAGSSSITEEDEDMANCLMLLARGRNAPESPAEDGFNHGGGTNKFGEAAATRTTGGGKPGLHVYECKTCSKCFPSFQALGGHRASHKKPKAAVAPPTEEKKAAAVDKDRLHTSSSVSDRSRVHECSMCGSEFSSGQALGGHMRRHRPILPAAGAPETRKVRNVVLSLDLNLPAPSYDHHHEELPTSPSAAVAFPFDSQQLVVFSASPLVDCHY